MKTCSYCNKPHATTRPYGPAKRLICLACASADPELWAIACMHEIKANENRRRPKGEALIAVIKALFPEVEVLTVSSNANAPSQNDMSAPCSCNECKRQRAERHARAN